MKFKQNKTNMYEIKFLPFIFLVNLKIYTILYKKMIVGNLYLISMPSAEVPKYNVHIIYLYMNN